VEQILRRAPIALALQQFPLGDLAFDRPIPVGQLSRGLHRGVCVLEAAGEVHQLWHSARQAVHEPGVEDRGGPCTPHLANALGQRLGRRTRLVMTSRL
jgi:hypothetical protein